jgi:glycogen debranching enzyme
LTSRVCYRVGDGARALEEREWLVTNGLGGYASGTTGGALTRRFHGWLVAALPPPRGRVLLLNALDDDAGELQELRLELGLPVWRYPRFERRVLLPHGRNVTLVTWRALAAMTLRVRPAFQIRAHEGPVAAPARDYPVAIDPAGCTVDLARLEATRGDWRAIPPQTRMVHYAIEAERGYDCDGPLVTPCEFSVELAAGEEVTLAISVEAESAAASGAAGKSVVANAGAFRIEQAADAVRAELARRTALIGARTGVAAELALAADQFVIRKSTGGTTVIAGYHWFTDWGRDTMISLEGLCLRTGRVEEAGLVLRTFAAHVRDGLIPNLFPEGKSQGLYHTADATLWFFHAIDRYLQVSKDAALLRDLLPTLQDIIEHHLRGTLFGIGVDPQDGLLRQGAEGYQLTWMDAKVDGWVVTPRRGKAVELNALFYNALCNLSRWLGGDARLDGHAARLRKSFNQRFYNASTGYLFDVLDPDDASLRPNQVLAISLPNPVLDQARWATVLARVREELLTPVGLRSLGPREPEYKPRYFGDLRTRDAAYHQGTVWAWLIGPFVDAFRKTHPGEDARALLAGFDLGEYGLGSVAEIFDAEPPFTPRGCIAQAWSVAEVLRRLDAEPPVIKP